MCCFRPRKLRVCESPGQRRGRRSRSRRLRFGGGEAIDWLFLNVDALMGETVIFGDVAEDDRAVPGSLRQLVLTATLRPVPALRADLSLQSSRIWRRTDETRNASLYADAVIPRLKVEYQATRRLGLRTSATASCFAPPASRPTGRPGRVSSCLAAMSSTPAAPSMWGGPTSRAEPSSGRWHPSGVAKATYVWGFDSPHPTTRRCHCLATTMNRSDRGPSSSPFQPP